MGEDPAQARAALEAEAERLKQKRVADEQAKVDRVAAYQNEKRAEEKAVKPKYLRKALSRVLWFWGGVTCLLVGVAVWGPAERDEEQTPAGREPERRVLYVASALGLAMIAWHYSAIARSQVWRNKLPFKLLGFEEVLGLGAAVMEIAAVAKFKDTPAKEAVVAELVRAHLEESTVSLSNGELRIASPRLSREGANWPAAGWTRTVIAKVLQDVHRGYPIESVQLFAVKTDEFYVPSGD